MKAEELLQEVLEIDASWQIVRLREDLGKQQIDVWVGRKIEKSGWLFGAKVATVSAEREQTWRHLNLGDTRCLIHTEPTGDMSATPWCGEPGQPFTHAMSRRIVSMMRDGIKLQSICAILDIGVGDLWKFKHSLDSGKTALTATAATLPPEEADVATRIPEPDSPLWESILDGSVAIDVRLLSLRLLLTKMREQMRLITDPEVRLLKCYELQRFFVRYEKTLGHELAQIEKLG